MDVQRIVFGGLKANAMVVWALSTLVTAWLYVKYSIDSYAVTNTPSELLLPSYDFVGSGSAGTFAIFSGSIEFQKIENSIIQDYYEFCAIKTSIIIQIKKSFSIFDWPNHRFGQFFSTYLSSASISEIFVKIFLH